MPDVLKLRWRMQRVGMLAVSQVFAMVGDSPSRDDLLMFSSPHPFVAEHIVLLHNASLES